MNKNINQNAPVYCIKSISIDADIEIVWKVLTNINQWSNWQEDIVSAKLNGKLNLDSTFSWKSGGVKIKSAIHTIEPFENLGWTGKTFGLFAIHNWELDTVNGKIIINVSESMEGFLAALFKKQFNKTLKAGMQNWLNMLKDECERQELINNI